MLAGVIPSIRSASQFREQRIAKWESAKVLSCTSFDQVVNEATRPNMVINISLFRIIRGK